MKIKITDEDYEVAISRLYYGGSWEHVKTKALAAAAERLLKENEKERDALIAKSAACHDGVDALAEWFIIQDKIDKLFAQHYSLMRIAFPGSYMSSAEPPEKDD